MNTHFYIFVNFGTKDFLQRRCTGENRKFNILDFAAPQNQFIWILCAHNFSFHNFFSSVFTLILEFGRREFNPFDDREVTSKTVMSGNWKTRIFYIQKRVRKCFARWRRRRSCFIVVVVTISVFRWLSPVSRLKRLKLIFFSPYFFKEFNCLPTKGQSYL